MLVRDDAAQRMNLTDGRGSRPDLSAERVKYFRLFSPEIFSSPNSVRTERRLCRHDAAGDAQHGGTPLGWCCHGSLHGNRTHDHAEVARLLLAAGAVPGDDTAEASAAVRAVIG
jgi:hypothetical protein